MVIAFAPFLRSTTLFIYHDNNKVTVDSTAWSSEWDSLEKFFFRCPMRTTAQKVSELPLPDELTIRSTITSGSDRVLCYALTFYVINLIGPWSTLTIWLTSWRFTISVECLGSRSACCTPSTILNCKYMKSSLLSCLKAFADGIKSCFVVSIQNRILSLQCRYGSVIMILKTSDRFVG